MASRGDTSLSSKQTTGSTMTLMLLTLAALALKANFAEATADALPHLCDNVHCPPLDDISCPVDSEIRESIMPIAAALMQPLNAADETALIVPPHLEPSYNASEIIDEELYSQCCVAKKCICRTCYIPDCHAEHEVVYELTPELMETPGKCCGTYECRPEPNCNEVRDTESYWMTNCQRCKCFSGERICHQSCDEGVKGSMAICNSKSLNRFFKHGESWKNGCYECECVNGEEKCVMSFCRSVNCPQSRQVMLKDSCCPICWPANITMPNAQDAEYVEEPLPMEVIDNAGYDDDDDDEDADVGDTVAAETADDELDVLPNLVLNNDVNATATTTTSTTTAAATTTTTTSSTTTTTAKPTTTSTSTTSSTIAPTTSSTTTATPFLPITATTSTTTTSASPLPIPAANPTTTIAPCLLHNRHEAPATYQVYPEVVEVIRQTQHNDLLYAIIGCLALAVVLLVAWNIHLRAKQRSYRPVSNIDDNFNKMSSNIKKMNEFV